ncbi:hypothetical protein EPD60_11880 [Flaviaesturariibacter flavus]|uniref:Zinc-finger domain-containing protein n=1 Tax=Flaviaesturariibacter flavus TaxID=2502780 RepID=A0A4R1BA19_9BACT|nr:hypothetical protein [Flaviaesturariibacter flavus]TCJ13786.1 hypothetical protein EPD60_11880 [Flaviaesturariibacter flavus]
MKPLPEEMEMQLWEYIDGIATGAQKSAIERLLAENAAWRARYEELLETHQLLAATELETPSLRFSRNVMEAIAQEQIAPAARHYINNRVIWGLAGFFLALIAATIIYALGQGSAAPAPQGADELVRVDFSRLLDNNWVNAFLMINILLGLFLLDRFLSARRQQQLDRL